MPFLLIWSISLRTFENADLEAVTLADKMVLVRGGTIGLKGSPLELFKRLANTFVTGFLGSPSMNFHPENHKGIFSEDLDDGQPSQKHARHKMDWRCGRCRGTPSQLNSAFKKGTIQAPSHDAAVQKRRFHSEN
ncbi:hypothetical protein [Roseibium sp.]|uniref:hypothetical protein n=1 Tax=Roseibium sp. TaxID=1936156 RepID=UPI003D9C23BB